MKKFQREVYFLTRLNTWLVSGLVLMALAAQEGVWSRPLVVGEAAVGKGIAVSDLGAYRCGEHVEIRMRSQEGRTFKVLRDPNGVVLVPAGDCGREDPPPDDERLLDGVVGRGEGDIAWAWLALPTGRYDHGILGDAVEAAALRVLSRVGDQHTFRLNRDSVFEDRHARIVDLDGDGSSEVLAIRSYLERGASLALFGLRGDKLVMLADSRPIGRAHRWLNIVGVGDFDGDGRNEVAVVLTPHIGGTLALYARHGGELIKEYSAFGFSNHAIGSREQGMGAVFDADGDGVPDLMVPGAARNTLRIVTFAGGRFQPLGAVALPARVVTGLHLPPPIAGEGSVVVYGLEDGTLRALTVSATR